MELITTEIGILFQAIAELEHHVFENEIEYFQNNIIQLETPNGFDNVNGLIKKHTKFVEIKFENNTTLKCAQFHILFDEFNNEKFANDFSKNDFVFTKNGKLKIIDILKYEDEIDLYDLEIDNKEHSYYDALGVKHHNTLICAALCDSHGRAGYRTITVVPSADLVRQTTDWYELCGLDVGVYSGDKKEIDHAHVVATWQALQNNPHLLSFFQCFVWDEVHGAAASVAQKLMNVHGSHIPFRYGVTGTFPKPEVDRLSLHSSIGDILAEIPASWLIENGYLAEVEIEPIELKENVSEDFIDYASERAYLAKSPARIDFIADLIIAKAETYGNTLVLVSSIQFGKKLQKLIKGSVFLYGASEKDERKENYDLFETENNLIVIATFGIASTGISINRVFCEVMIDGGKSFIKAIQSVGRGTRLAHDKKKVHVVDLYSSLNWSKKHSRERKKYFKAAQYTILPTVTYKIKN
ncbi:MAG: helicase-related protein [Candidatus Nitrosotenuis sp.]